MNNELTLTLKLTFTEDAEITQRDKEAIIDNVLLALRQQIKSGDGIAPSEPEKNDYITDIIEIRHEKTKTGIVWDMKEDVQI